MSRPNLSTMSLSAKVTALMDLANHLEATHHLPELKDALSKVWVASYNFLETRSDRGAESTQLDAIRLLRGPVQ